MKRSLRAMLAVLVLVSLVAASCGDDKTTSTDSGPTTTAAAKTGPKIVIGIQDFGESKVLAQIYGQVLTAHGYSVEYKELGGYRDLVFAGFTSGDINFTPEYAASALEFLNENKGEATSDATATVDKLRTYLADKQLVAYDAAPAVDTNSLVVTAATAKDKKLTKVSDLTADLKLGGPQDCLTNPFCIQGIKKVYGVDLTAGFQALDGGGKLTKAALTAGSIDVAIIFSTDSSIAANKWVALEDDKHLFAADNIIPVTTDAVTKAYGEELESLVNSVSAKVTTAALLDLNDKFDNKKEDADKVAADFISSAGLGS